MFQTYNTDINHMSSTITTTTTTTTTTTITTITTATPLYSFFLML